ncbi:MAG: hypothetical protein ABII25_04350, partial [bacterium]
GGEDKGEIRIDEKYGFEESFEGKVVPKLLIKERSEKIIKTRKKRNSQIDLDFSFGNYNSLSFQLNHRRNLKKMSYSFALDKKLGNKSRPNSKVDHNTFGGQLFSDKIDFAFEVNSNKFDLPGMINNPISGSARICNNYKFSFDIKTNKKLFFILKGENTNIKEQTSQKNQSFNLKILYDFIKNKSPYTWTGEIEENKLKNKYNDTFYSFKLENRAISLNEKSHAKIGAGLSKEEGGKIYLNPNLRVFYKYNAIANLEAGLKRQDEKIEFYDLYGENNFSQLNFSPLKRINYWQIYSKAFMRLDNNTLLDAKIFHDWIENFVVFDDDEVNPDGFWMPINLKNVQKDGIRISCLKKILPEISGEVDYQYLIMWNGDKSQTVPLQSNGFSAVIKYDNPLFQLSIDGKYKGKRYYDKDSNEKLGGYFLLGYLIEKPVSEKLTFYAKGSNILDKKYEIIKSYPGERAKFLMGCKYNF